MLGVLLLIATQPLDMFAVTRVSLALSLSLCLTPSTAPHTLHTKSATRNPTVTPTAAAKSSHERREGTLLIYAYVRASALIHEVI